jgi:arsenate reductase
MSDALFQRGTNGRHQSRSAGTRPAEHVHPVVADAMREVGIDISGNRPQKLTDDLAQWADIVVTMGCGDECPYVPGKRYIDWDLTDPADKSLPEVRAIREEISRRVLDLAQELDGRPARNAARSAN